MRYEESDFYKLVKEMNKKKPTGTMIAVTGNFFTFQQASDYVALRLEENKEATLKELFMEYSDEDHVYYVELVFQKKGE